MNDKQENSEVPLFEEEATVAVAQDDTTDVTRFTSSAPVVENAYTPEEFPKQISSAPTDGSLAEFLARPVLIDSVTWTPEIPAFNGGLDPWTTWLNVTSVRSKIQNFHFLRGNLCLKLQINGTPFHYGRLMFSYQPAFGEEVSPPSAVWSAMSHSTLTHVILDPSTNAEGRITCPFLTPYTWIDLASDRTQWIGRLYYDQLAELTISNGTLLTGLEVQIYAWMEHAELCYPTTATLPAFTPQSSKIRPKAKKTGPNDEYQKDSHAGLISKPAATVANIASKLVEVPVIGSFARATEIGAGAISKIAGLFGYSRPRELAIPTRVYQTSAPFMSVTDAPDNAIPLTLGSKSELSIDPRINGENTSGDQLSIQAIAGKWSYVKTVTWAATAPLNAGLDASLIHPYMGTASSGTVQQKTAMGFAARPFRYWRGSIEVKIQIVCSRFHRGRIRFAYSPDGNTASASETNLNYGRIIDISQANEYIFNIPYARGHGFLLNTNDDTLYVPEKHNGAYYLSVQNPLSNPEATAKDVQIIIWYRAGPDFQVAVPQDVDIFKKCIAEYQSANSFDEMGLAPETITDHLWEQTEQVGVHETFIGDPVASFRPLLKRYERVFDLVWGDTFNDASPGGGSVVVAAANNSSLYLDVPYYPPDSGRMDTLGGTFSTTGVGSFDYNYNRTTLHSYLSMAFAGRKGSYRWLVRTKPPASLEQTGSSIWRFTGSSFALEGFYQLTQFGLYILNTGIVPAAIQTRFLNLETRRNYLTGYQEYDAGNILISYEAAPYNAVRFLLNTPGNDNLNRINDGFPDGHVVVQMDFQNRSGANVDCTGTMSQFSAAAGEDFTFVGWRGIPPMDEVNIVAAPTDSIIFANTQAR